MVRGLLRSTSSDDDSTTDDSVVPVRAPPPQPPRKLNVNPQKSTAITAKARGAQRAAASSSARAIRAAATAADEPNSSVELFPATGDEDAFEQEVIPPRICIPKLRVWLELCEGNLIYPRFIFGYGAVLQDKRRVLLLPSGVEGSVKVTPGESYGVVFLHPQPKPKSRSAQKQSPKKGDPAVPKRVYRKRKE